MNKEAILEQMKIALDAETETRDLFIKAPRLAFKEEWLQCMSFTQGLIDGYESLGIEVKISDEFEEGKPIIVERIKEMNKSEIIQFGKPSPRQLLEDAIKFLKGTSANRYTFPQRSNGQAWAQARETVNGIAWALRSQGYTIEFEKDRENPQENLIKFEEPVNEAQ